MKIVIVGAGLSGLSTHLFLKKHLPNPSPPASPHEITIYESQDPSSFLDHEKPHEDFDTAPSQSPYHTSHDSGIFIAPNGLHVLRRLDVDLFTDILRTGHSISVESISSARGCDLGSTRVQSDEKPPMNSLLISYRALQRCFRELIPDGAIVHKEVSEVVDRGEIGPRVCFADGSEDVECDLVLRCDGLQGIVGQETSAKDPSSPQCE